MEAENTEYLTMQEAADMANRTKRTIEYWIKDDLLKVQKGIKGGRRRLVIIKAELQAMI